MSLFSDSELVERTIRHVERLEFELDMARELLRATIERDSWRRFRTPNGNQAEHERFIDFLVAPQPFGLGADEGLLDLLDIPAEAA